MSDLRPATPLASFSRRVVLAAALSAVTLEPAGLALAQAQRGPAQVPVDELMKSDLPEIVIGKPDAPVTIVEYASMACSHCAAFHNETLPKLKAKHIDTGSVRLVFREFPLDRLSATVSVLARCVGGEGTLAFIGEMFKRQDEWADLRAAAAIKKLQEIAQQHGLGEAAFNACLGDKKLLGQIEAGRERASKRFGVRGTPAFFVNGQRLAAHGLGDFDKAIEPLLKK